MRVKICGVKSLEAIQAAADAGATMIGYNFYPPSSRYIDPEACRMLQDKVKAAGIEIAAVGVFVNESRDHLEAITSLCGLDYAQISGDESGEFTHSLSVPWFRAIRPRSAVEAADQARAFVRSEQVAAAPQLLVDAYRPGVYGGSGHTSDWGLAASLASQFRILLAGGLGPENVSQAIQEVQPWGVDVASGVESEPGKKNIQKIQDFISASGGAA
jgi:phosphoribosylanthranilate isomerase